MSFLTSLSGLENSKIIGLLEKLTGNGVILMWMEPLSTPYSIQ